MKHLHAFESVAKCAPPTAVGLSADMHRKDMLLVGEALHHVVRTNTECKHGCFCQRLMIECGGAERNVHKSIALK